MRLIVLGSGTCVPSLSRNAPGYYLSVGGRHVLVDCGDGTLLQLQRAAIHYGDIDAVFITHTHPDHIAGLIPFIHALIATPGLERTKSLSLIFPEGTASFYETCMLTLMRKPRTFDIDVVEINEKLDMGSFFVFSASTVHSDTSRAYRFEDQGKSAVITGDSDYDDSLAQFARNADLLVADCSFPDAMKVGGHMTPKECGLLAKNAGAQKLILSHIYPAPSPDAERITECRSVFNGDIILAEDLMEIAV